MGNDIDFFVRCGVKIFNIRIFRVIFIWILLWFLWGLCSVLSLAKLREALAQKDTQIALHTAELARKDPQLALNTTEDMPPETMQHALEDDFVAELDVAMWTGDVLVTFDA